MKTVTAAEKTAHTPGEWRPGHLGSDSTCQCANVLSEGYAGAICTIHIGNGMPIGEGGNDAPPRAEAIANMHLISAAPEMLAALLNVRSLISAGAMTGFNWQDGDWAEKLFLSQQVTSAAIAKATQS